MHALRDIASCLPLCPTFRMRRGPTAYKQGVAPQIPLTESLAKRSKFGAFGGTSYLRDGYKSLRERRKFRLLIDAIKVWQADKIPA